MRRMLAVIALCLVPAIVGAAEPDRFEVSYAGGGTEIRGLVAHGGRLFAANGYWKDAGGAPGAQVLVLDRPGGAWRVDHVFGDLLPGGRRRHLAVSVLGGATFRTDARGATLPSPQTVLLASTWDLTGTRTVFVRDDATGEWPGSVLAQDRPTPGFLPQVRAFGSHRDRVTGADLAFAGDTRGIFSAGWTPDAPGHLSWTRQPELEIGGLSVDGFPGLSGRLRISSFAEAGGRLFAAIGQQVWVRQDGAAPRWTVFYTNADPHYSQTGLRGLATVSEPGHGEVLLAAVEGRQARILRIDPQTGAEVIDLDLAGLLDRAWGTRVSYVLAAYNDMTPAGNDLLIGLEAFIPPNAPRPPGHTVLDVNHGLEGGAWFLVRHPGGGYDLHQMTARFPVIGQDLVAVRCIAASPFAGEPGVLYLGGYDANDAPAHDTAWVARGVIGR